MFITFREGEERGNCSAALKEQVKLIRDQVGERSVVVLVRSKESAIWQESSMKAVFRCVQRKNIDVEGMRVVTRHRVKTEKFGKWPT